MSSLALVEITRTDGATDAFRALSLDIVDKEIMALTGPRGGGKAALLRCIAGLERVDGGEIFIAGAPVSTVSARARGVALVDASPPARLARKVETLLAKAAGRGNIPRQDRAKAVGDMLETLEIAELAATRLGDAPLAGQRLAAIGAAVLARPALLLLHDPFVGLNSPEQLHARRAMRALREQRAATMLFVTSNPLEALAIGQRTAVMAEGKIVDRNKSEALFRSPRHVAAAAWLGDPGMNVLPAQRSGDRTLSLGPAITLTLPFERAQELPQNQQEYLVAFRPEHLELFSLDDPAPRGPRYQLERCFWEVPLDAVEPWGLGALVYLRLNDHPLAAKPALRPAMQPGENAHISVLAARCHIYHALDGRLISAGKDA